MTNSRESFTDVVLAVHGGAGVITRRNMTAASEAEYLKHLSGALQAGYRLLKKGKTSLDAVEAAVRYLEDCPLFNAGRGAVFTCDGKNELDAAIMDGKQRSAGAVAAVTRVKNPVSAARAVMEKTEHVLLVGRGADRFAATAGLDLAPPSYFYTERRWQQLQEVRGNSRRKHLKERPVLEKSGGLRKYGTVGAVACDRRGNLAAATSTGGIINKHYGRVGDSPLIGAGTYADNRTAAVSATGQGEYFIRAVAAYDLCALMRYKRMSLARAAAVVVHESLPELGGEGGLIAIDARGNCALPFNTEGMFRGCITADGNIYTAIYGD